VCGNLQAPSSLNDKTGSIAGGGVQLTSF
jgi:hypothetical protein